MLLVIAGVIYFPTAENGPGWLFSLINCLIFLLFLYLWQVIRRLPVRPLTKDFQINQQFNDLTKFYWSLLVVLMSTGTLLLFFVPLLSTQLTGVVGELSAVLFVLLLVFLMVVPFGLLLRLRKNKINCWLLRNNGIMMKTVIGVMACTLIQQILDYLSLTAWG
ncbi:hypothetical protein ODV97_15330 [Enterococcus gallinarum]|nr:hypothetical protein [Enterococcus gallinarum]